MTFASMPRSRSRLLLLALLIIATAASGSAPASAADDPEKAARAHFEAGHSLYRARSYALAAQEFLAAYAIAPKPQLLINAGLAFSKVPDIEKAREQYEQFLVTASSRDADRPSVERLLSELPPPLPPPPIKAPEVVPPAPVTIVLPPPPPPIKRSFAARHWWIFPVVGVVVAGGLATGLYFALRPHCGSALGCVDFPR